MRCMWAVPFLSLLAALCGSGASQTLDIYRDHPVSGRTLEVRNGAEVVVVLHNKSPFETCSMDEAKREAIAPETSALAQLIALGVSAAGTITGLSGPPATTREPPPSRVASPAGIAIVKRLDALLAQAHHRGAALKPDVEAFDRTVQALKSFFGAPPKREDFESRRAKVARLVGKRMKAPVGSIADLDLAYKAAHDLTAKLEADPSADVSEFQEIHEKIAEARGQLDVLTRTLTDLSAARASLKAIADYLRTLKKPEWEKPFTLNPGWEEKVTGKVSCADTQTKAVTLAPVYFTVRYHDLARVNVSGGVLVSLVEKRTHSVGPVLDGRPAGATANPHYEISREASRPQVVPFSLANVRLADWVHWGRQFTFNYTAGLGVNPNSGTNETEFVPLGVSLGIGSVYVSLVGHWARTPELTGGFQTGDRVGSDFKTPLRRQWNPGVAFGITYKLPLPSAR